MLARDPSLNSPLIPKNTFPMLEALIQKKSTPSCCVSFWSPKVEIGKIDTFLIEVDKLNQSRTDTDEDKSRKLVGLIDNELGKNKSGLFHNLLLKITQSDEYAACKQKRSVRSNLPSSVFNSSGEQ